MRRHRLQPIRARGSPLRKAMREQHRCGCAPVRWRDRRPSHPVRFQLIVARHSAARVTNRSWRVAEPPRSVTVPADRVVAVCTARLREAFFGLRRFEEFQQVVGCARNILSDRLAKLVANDLMRRTAYREDGQRERFEYQLTERGVELFPVLVALMQWGDRWLAGGSGVPVVVRHQGCGSPVRVELRCADGHGPLSPRQTLATPGDSARLARKAT